jgi:hypothetical protein
VITDFLIRDDIRRLFGAAFARPCAALFSAPIGDWYD